MFDPVLVEGAGLGHSRSMRGLRLGLALLLPVLGAGCGSDASSSAPASGVGQPHWGGQTGSLTPPSCVPTVATVPEGTSALVVDTDACPPGVSPDGIRITNADGEPVEVSAVPLGNGKYLITVEGVLETGSYDVSIDGTSTRTVLEVSDPTPLPTSLGTLTQSAERSCGTSLSLTLDPVALDYRSLLRLSVSVDGDPPAVWLDYGEVPTGGSSLPLTFSCPESCLTAGAHQIVVSGEIAGETAAPDSANEVVQVRCSSHKDDPGACALADRKPRSAKGFLLLVLALGLLAWRLWSPRRHQA